MGARGRSISASLMLGLQMCIASSSGFIFPQDFWGLNSGPYAGVARALPTKPSCPSFFTTEAFKSHSSGAMNPWPVLSNYSSRRVINGLLFIKIILLSPMDAFSFSWSVPFVALGAGHGLLQPIAFESSPRIQLSGPQQSCQCPDKLYAALRPCCQG